MKDNNLMLQIGITFMLTIITILAMYLIVDNRSISVADKVVAKMLAIEYDKVGGMENYVKINEISKKQIVEGLRQYDEQGGANQPQAANNQQAPSSEGGNISLEQAQKVTTEGTYILGSTDAEITWVEYSDLECPFCQRLHKAVTIEEVMKAYDGKVNFVFKQFPLSFHKQAPMEAEALLCAGDIAGTDKYYEFITEIFAKTKADGNSFDENSISELGANIGINKTKLLTCITTGKFKQKVQDEINEGSSLFGITGTPGNVLINNKTGKWDKLPGAYPTASFKSKIDSLLK